jgi:ABC-2 type transport system ATP-binding protein
VLVLRELRKRYGERVAVDGVSLELREGEIFGLLGPNGAGKSTLVNLAVGLLAPDEGDARLGDSDLHASRRARARVGLAPQELALYSRLTADENLRFFANLYGLAGDELERRVDWSLDFVGLRERRNDRVATFSGGMSRRLNLAAAVVHDPDLLLLDEPTVGVDPQSRNRLLENIEALGELGKTILYTTHYMEEAQRLCDRIAIIDHGRLLATDSVQGLLEAHAGPTTLEVVVEGERRTLETDEPLSTLNSLAANGDAPKDFRVRRPDLEQVFLHLTGRSLRD